MLDSSSAVHLSRDERAVRDPNGSERHRRPIKDMSEISKLLPQDLAMRTIHPKLFWYKVVTRQYLVYEKLTRMVRKQLVYILVDGSASMEGEKHLKAAGVAMNRLKSVLTGDAEVWLSVFDTRLKNVDHAENEEEALAIMRKFLRKSYTGGGTNIGTSVLSAHEHILELVKERNMIRPEIWVLTDEDDSINEIDPSQVEGTRVHGMAFSSSNRALERFCKATGGTYWGDV